MSILDTAKTIHASEFDWKTYYEEGIMSLKQRLESDPEMWKRWTNSDKRYMLVTKIPLIENDFHFNKSSGAITDYFDMHISSNSIENLRNIWQNFFFNRYDTTSQHFIADIKNKKIIEFVSVCM